VIINATEPISANGAKNGLVWAVECPGSGTSLAILHAYDAENVSNELYNSNQSSRDYAGREIRFTIPTVASKRVYVGTKGEVDVYGLLLEGKNIK